ncbi:tetratricopeptide repeat protein [Paraflavisolibacter sp. H34]|uniref:tetratricopeptide repeat protein n=1 Tax=Huijunlia imazamoxiresistens TaxID=3127457 RepID=UPI003015E929
MRSIFCCLLLLLAATAADAQSARQSLSRGNSYYRQGEFELAERLYRQAIKSDSANVMARYNLAGALFRQKKYKEAEEMLLPLTKTAPDKALRAAAFYNAGVLYSRQKDLEASIEAYKNALRLDPADEQARENLQKALLELKQKQQQQQRDQKEARKRQSRMSQREAERQLQRLQEKERQLQQRLQNKQGGTPMPKDW